MFLERHDYGITASYEIKPFELASGPILLEGGMELIIHYRRSLSAKCGAQRVPKRLDRVNITRKCLRYAGLPPRLRSSVVIFNGLLLLEPLGLT